MGQSLRGKEQAFRIYSAIHLLAGLSAWLLTFMYVPVSKYLLIASPHFTAKNLTLYHFYGAVFLLMLCSVFCLRLKIIMASNYFISFDIAFALAGFLFLGPQVGTLIAVFSTMFDIAQRAVKLGNKGKGLIFIMFDNLGNRLLRFSAMTYTAGLVDYQGAFHGSSGTTATVLFSLFIAYFAVNNLFYVPSEYFKGNSLRIFWRDTFRIDLLHTFLMFALAFYLTLISVRMGAWMSVATVLLILGAIFLIARLTHTEKELTRKVDELTILTSVSEAASSGLDLLPMVESFSKRLGEALGCEGIGVVFCQPYSTTLNAVQVEGEKSRTKQLPEEEKRYQYENIPLSEPSSKLGGSLYEFLQPLETAPFMIPQSVYGVPLIYRGEPIGGLVVYAHDPKADFSKKQQLLETCAHALVVGMENCFLHLQAIEDPLTGLYNRSYFLYRLKEELSYSSRHSSDFALLMLDLDDFKVVNDHLGHQVGDEVLKRIGDLFRFTLRKEDVPARYGGDEFVILLLDCDEANAIEKANKIKQLITMRVLPREKSQGIQLGCSVSLISSKALMGENNITTILKRLDKALYKAKSEGKNVIVKAAD